ncbi:hypothetical protein [Formosa maritima]|uniref:Glycosyltransferase family 39 protein n=1 Tax=Formosa maritima TaxID=2592046 RepID=A0A5D0GH77_9FLAO|nr:hypothetical protein [Formosa maritima]TYA58284.1 hypothetical protein FVF61_03670 [Formosa maritima]
MKNIKLKDIVIYGMYFFSFIFLIFQDAIYTPDTASYLNAAIYRYPGYAIFTNFLKFIFQDYFDLVTVGIQLLFGFIAVHFVAKKFTEVLQLNYLSKFILVAILLFPFFGPLYVANNICSEGLSYPLYLFFIVFSIDFLFKNNNIALIYICISSILLILTRGQFILVPFIIAFLFILKNRKEISKRNNLMKLLILVLIPITTILLDKSYHKLKDNAFASTPFTYVNTASLAFYVSKISDSSYIKNEEHKTIFIESHNFISSNKWIMSSKKRVSYQDYYKHFHKYLVYICNFTLHDKGTEYFLNKNMSIVESRLAIEEAAKSITPILIKNNFNKWVNVYFASIIHGFKSIYILLFVLGVFLFSLIKVLISYKKNYAILFMVSSLTLSNSMIVATASYSIMRFYFYNYALLFIMIIIIYKIFIEKRQKNI